MAKDLAIYIHIPFCVRKCNYCDFLSFYAEKELMDSYFGALKKEIALRAKEYGCGRLKSDQEDDGEGYVVRSIFFGGGTPSFADCNDICAILREIKERFVVSEDAEISIEVNPASAMGEKLFSYKAAGFNRISIGCQSLNDGELKVLGRAHNSAMFYETFENARKAGFGNINVDVMSALPGQSLESYMSTLKKVVELRPEHISAYSLIIEEGTPFYDMDLDLPGEDLDREMYHETKRFLSENGYHRYEISNYALDASKECRHNKEYWRRGNYLGFGIGAASMVENVRWSNVRKVKRYIEVMGSVTDEEGMNCEKISEMLSESEPKSDELFPIIMEDVQKLSLDEQMEEFMFLGLRLVSGVSVHEFKRQFGRKISNVYGEVIDKYLRLGLLEYSGADDDREIDKVIARDLDGDRYRDTDIARDTECLEFQAEKGLFLRLTDKGLDVSNTVMAEFLF